MKFVNEKRLYSLNEITTSLSITRKELLDLESLDIIKPTYKDNYSLYRYYDPLIILDIIEIKELLNAGISIQELKYFKDNKLSKKDLNYILKRKESSLNNVKLLFEEEILSFYKKNQGEIIYYYESRNITDFSIIPSLMNNLIEHALSKNYIFDNSSFPFVLISKDSLMKETKRIRICLPLIKKYNEENIEIIKESNTCVLDSSLSLTKSFSIFLDLLNKNNFKSKNTLMFIYYKNNLNINRIIGFLN